MMRWPVLGSIQSDGSGFEETSFEQNLGNDPRNHAEQLGRKAGEALKPRVAQWLVF